MRGFLIAMASLAFIGGLNQEEPDGKPKPTPDIVVQPFNPTDLPPLEPQCEVVPVEQVVATDPLTGISVTGPTVIMVSAKWCEPCQTFKLGPMPGELAAKRWDFVVDENETAKVRMYPTYRIYDGKKWVQVEGVLTAAKMKAAINPGPVRRIMQNAVSTVSQPVSYQSPVNESYTPRWQNFDGMTRLEHASKVHGMDVIGKSEAQVLREMDAYHDRYGGGHPVKSASAMSSGCPTGNCPTQRQFFVRR